MHDRRYDASVPLCLCSFFLFFLHISLLCRHLAVLLCFFLALLCSLIYIVLDLSLLSFLYIPPRCAHLFPMSIIVPRSRKMAINSHCGDHHHYPTGTGS